MLNQALKLIKDKKLFVADLRAGKVKEVELLVKDGAAQDFNMYKDKGLGDTIARFTSATGIKRLTESIMPGCGCKSRQVKLNEYFPYNKKNG